EVFLSRKLAEMAKGGKEGIVLESLSRVFDSYVKQIVANSGEDPDEVLTELKARHAKGEKRTGFDAFSGRITDVIEKGIFNPYRVKKMAYLAALETATILLRVDDVIMAAKMKPPKGKEGGAEE
ncbi:MAG: TCP-1/cpn60 chaperonin family protein, partial [Thermoproteota archaeon]